MLYLIFFAMLYNYTIKKDKHNSIMVDLSKDNIPGRRVQFDKAIYFKEEDIKKPPINPKIPKGILKKWKTEEKVRSNN